VPVGQVTHSARLGQQHSAVRDAQVEADLAPRLRYRLCRDALRNLQFLDDKNKGMEASTQADAPTWAGLAQRVCRETDAALVGLPLLALQKGNHTNEHQ